MQLDAAFGDRSPRDIPIYIGATGEKMLGMAAEIVDGAVLNYVVSMDYIQRAIATVEKVRSRPGEP